MRTEAVLIREPGDQSRLEVGTVDVREPGHGEVLVQVGAAGVNRADLLQRRGLYPAPSGFPDEVAGLEYAGEVAGVGSGVTTLSVGDRVMGLVGSGAMARHVVVSEREVLPVPERLSLTEAAAVPEAFLTAYDALILQAGLGVGEAALIHSIASGVGTAALQIARLIGARPVGTTRTPSKAERLGDLLSFDDTVIARDARFADAVEEKAAGKVHVVLDTVGASYMEENLRCLRLRGRWVLLGLLGGARATVPLDRLLTGRIHLMGTVLRSRPPEERAALATQATTALIPHLASGRLRPVIDRVVPMTRAEDGHRALAGNETCGKVVLEWS